MSEMKTVDARGLSCPEPMLLTRQALKEGGGFAVLVSAAVARDNVMALVQREGRAANLEDDGDGWRIVVGG